MTGERFRQLALELPGAEELSHMGHPDFRVGGKIFASLPGDESFGVVNLGNDAETGQESFVERYQNQFEPLAGGWGRRGWTRVVLKKASVAAVRAALRAAWSRVVPASSLDGAKSRASLTGERTTHIRRYRPIDRKKG